MKKRLFIATLLVGVLAIGITGGTVLAQEGGSEDNSPVGKFASRVASILGLDEAQVEDAMKQAARELQDEALQEKLNRMVENGVITQEEADAYYEWFMARPDIAAPILKAYGFHRFGMLGGHGRHIMPFWNHTPAPAPESSETTSL